MCWYLKLAKERELFPVSVLSELWLVKIFEIPENDLSLSY